MESRTRRLLANYKDFKSATNCSRICVWRGESGIWRIAAGCQVAIVLLHQSVGNTLPLSLVIEKRGRTMLEQESRPSKRLLPVGLRGISLPTKVDTRRFLGSLVFDAVVACPAAQGTP